MKKNKSKKAPVALIVIIFVLLLLLGGAGYYFANNSVYKHCMVEAGTDVLASDFAILFSDNISFADESPRFDVYTPGDYSVILKVFFFKFKSELTVVDTVKPKCVSKDLSIKLGERIDATDFLTDVVDETNTSVAFVKEPDYKEYGTQTVLISVKDLGDNETIVSANLFISPLTDKVTIEAGSEFPDPALFYLKDASKKLKLRTDPNGINTSLVGENEIKFESDKDEFFTILEVVDTVSPEFEVQDIDTYMSSGFTIEDFIVSSFDETALSFTYETEPDLEKEGEQDVVICATDLGGNVTKKEAKLTLTKDDEAPVIKGVHDIVICVGEGVSYKSGVTVKDNCDEDIKLLVDTGGANINVPGTYTITYSAVDRAGNSTVLTATLNVSEAKYDEATVFGMADYVLSVILKPEMTQKEILDAIYAWVRYNLTYINHSEKDGYLRGAYEGLKYRKGDCYVFFAITKVLLTRAGIKNMDIQKVPGYGSMHYWNLVDIGDGWYHYDTCPRYDAAVFNYVTDAELMDYSAKNYNSHLYDASLYPEIN